LSGSGLRTFVGFFCEILGFLKFPFGSQPKLFITTHRSAVFFPDFPGALSNSTFAGSCQGAGSLFQFFRQQRYISGRLPIANPPREFAILSRFR
jgi:hypothetical protein